MGHVTRPRPFRGWFVIRRLWLAMFNPHTKFEVSTITCNEDIKGNTKCKNSRFEPPFGGLRSNAQSLSKAWWKVHCHDSDNWTFSLALTAEALLSEICRNRRFLKGLVVRSFVNAGRGPAYSGPQRWDLYGGPMRQPRERRGIGRCVRCMCELCRVEEGLSRREQLVRYF